MTLNTRLAKKLQQRLDNHRYRIKTARQSAQDAVVHYEAGRPLISFCSNDYLGLANHPEVIEAFKSGVDQYGVGSGSAALVSGRCHAHHALEAEIADFLGRPAALLFSTGYMANLGVLSALLTRGDHLFQDRANHASLMDAAVLSRAKHYRFPHRNTGYLASKLAELDDLGASLIVSDGVFSTNGDLAPIEALIQTAKAHQAWLMIDDAHGIGCLGDTGKGLLEHCGVQTSDVDVLVGTFGKALGTFGAFVAGNELLIDTLTQFAKSYVYTTALPPALVEATRASLKIMINEPERRTHLQKLITHFKQGAKTVGLALLPSVTPIQAIHIGEDKQALKMGQALYEQGFLVKPFRTPTVPQGEALLRITLTANHTAAQIDPFIEALEAIR